MGIRLQDFLDFMKLQRAGAMPTVDGDGKLSATKRVKRGGVTSLPLRVSGFPALSGSAAVTRHTVRKLPCEFAAWRATIHNAGAVAPSYKVGISVGNTAAELYNNAGIWWTATWAAANSVVAPVGSGTIPDHQFGTAMSDLMINSSPSDGVNLYIRSYADIANNTRFDLSNGSNDLAVFGFFGAFQAGVDAVATPSALSAPGANPSFPPVTIELFTASQIRQVGVCGASTAHGQGDPANIGWAWRANTSLNADGSGLAWSLANLSAPTSTTAASATRALKEISERTYQAVIYWVYSTNDADSATAAGTALRKGRMIQFIETCAQYGIVPVLATFQSSTGMSAGQYTECKIANNYARQLAASGACGLFDIAALLSDEASATPAWRDPTLTTDGTHPNAAGSAALAVYAVAVLPRLLA